MQWIYYFNSLTARLKFSLMDVARGGSGTAETSKIEHLVLIVNSWRSLTIITKSFLVDVAAVLDPPLVALFR